MKKLTPIELNNPVLICSWQGWPDAAESATKSVEEILSQLEVIHSHNLNSDSYYIYSDKRPTVTNVKNNRRHIDWLENKFSFIKPKTAKNDIIIFEGIEPDMNWKSYVKDFINVIKFYEIKNVIMVGALLDSVPHTREPRISFTATANKTNPLLKKISYTAPTYEGPAGITSAIGEKLDKLKVSSISIWGHTPHYLQVTHNPILSAAIMKEISNILNLKLNFEKITKRSEEFRSSLNLALEDHNEINKYVERLEESYDTEEMSKIDPEPQLILKDLENFLKDQRQNQE
ncbi:MAG: PAC2 family protein [Dehalococcoidia bacterium]|nr:PAC2 family protein [Dehalococcoidia bacterium]